MRNEERTVKLATGTVVSDPTGATFTIVRPWKSGADMIGYVVINDATGKLTTIPQNSITNETYRVASRKTLQM